MNNHHDLKCFTDNFQPIVDGHKKSTVRLNDRNFQVNDTLTFHEGQLEDGSFQYTDRIVSCRISYIDNFGTQEGYVSLSLSRVGLLIVE